MIVTNGNGTVEGEGVAMEITVTPKEEPIGTIQEVTVTVKEEPVVPQVNEEEELERKSKQFLKELQQFHDNTGTPFVRHPKINGKDIDLYQLYTEVTKLGGWVKVNQRNDWDEILEAIDFPRSCVNAPVAIKYIYIRYLDRYEKLNFLGEEVERVVEDDEDVRQKKMSSRFLHNIPMTYNHVQHVVSDANRLTHKLSTDYFKLSEYEKLFMSLLSPLPNEQDFAINVCTLMANETKSSLKVEKCPKLIDALLAHAGVYSHYATRKMFTEYYSGIRKHSLQKFWTDSLSKRPHILELSLEDLVDITDDKLITVDTQESSVEDSEDLHLDPIAAFLSLERGLGTHDYIGQRVHQVAAILRNITFAEENSWLFARNRSFLRFLVMCANVRWNNLHHMALDMLGNVASDVELADPVIDGLTRCLLGTVVDGIQSEDRGVIISSLEILYKLCGRLNNEDYLHKCFDKSLFEKISMYLSLNDIMLLLYTLECVYAMTNFGEKTCSSFVHVKGLVDTLVSLVTVEAQSFGADGCILMRVVETIPHPGVGTAAASAPAPDPSRSPQYQANEKKLQNLTTANKVVTNQPLHSPHQQSKMAAPVKVQPSPNVIAAKHAQQQLIQENEQFAQTWLRATCETSDSLHDKIEQQELYKLYVTSVSKMGRRGVVTPVHFPRCVRSVFGGAVGPTLKESVFSFDGLRLKPKAVPTVVKNTQPTTPVPAQQQVLVSSSGTTSMTTTKPPPSAAVAVASVIQQVAKEQVAMHQQHLKTHPPIVRAPVPMMSSPAPFPVTSASPISTTTASAAATAQSSLIKSLLANKVTTAATTIMQPSVVTVTQAALKQQHQQPPLPMHPTKPQTVFINAVSNANTIPINIPSTATAQPRFASAVITGISNNNNSSSSSGQPQQPTVIMSSSVSHHSQNFNNNNRNSIKSNPSYSSASPLTMSSSSNPNNTKIIASNMNEHQVVQRQQLQKQKEMAQRMQQTAAIIAPVPPNLKPKTVISIVPAPVAEHNKTPPPPLAPLSSGSTAQSQASQSITLIRSAPPAGGSSAMNAIPVIKTVASSEPGPSSAKDIIMQAAEHPFLTAENLMDGVTPPFEDDDDGDAAGSKHSKVSANKMLADLLDKKSDPPSNFGSDNSNASSSSSSKRKMSGDSSPPSTEAFSGGPPPTKRSSQDDLPKATPSAANLYAEMAAQILEDDDDEPSRMEMEEAPPRPVIEQPKVMPPHQQMITLPLRQQIIVSPNQTTNHPQSQVIMAPQHHSYGQQSTATIKTETGYQTVPILLQQHNAQSGQQQQQLHHHHHHSQQQMQHHTVPVTTTGTMLQRQSGGQQTTTTQYVLATNPQGQTYVVATQAPIQQQQQQPMQTLLVTQTPQQQGTNSKTIIILQQQPPPNQQHSQQQQQHMHSSGGGSQITSTPIQQAISSQTQKMIITTPSGQQVVMHQQPQSQPIIQQRPVHQIVLGSASSSQQSNVIVQQQQQQQHHIHHQHHHQLQHHHQASPAMPSHQTTQIIQKQVVLPPPPQTPANQIVQRAPAPLEAVSMENIPQHVIKTSTGLQIKPVNPTPQKIIVTPQQPQIPIAAAPTTSASVVQQQQIVPDRSANDRTMTTSQTIITSATPSSVLTTVSSLSAPPSAASSPVPSQSSAVLPRALPQSTPMVPAVRKEPTPTPPPQPPTIVQQQQFPQPIPMNDNGVDVNWPYVCDWRGCPRKKFRSANEVFWHACQAHCPDSLEKGAEIFCQWGPGPMFCDGQPRKRFCLMTHIQDRHCTLDALKGAVQRRLVTGIPAPTQALPVTIIKNLTTTTEQDGSAFPANSSPSTHTLVTMSALQAVRRHSADFVNPRELRDDNEGPVTKSIRLTASLILRNLVTYSDSAKRMLRLYESHLAQIALSNVESSRTIAQVLYEMNDVHPV